MQGNVSGNGHGNGDTPYPETLNAAANHGGNISGDTRKTKKSFSFKLARTFPNFLYHSIPKSHSHTHHGFVTSPESSLQSPTLVGLDDSPPMTVSTASMSTVDEGDRENGFSDSFVGCTTSSDRGEFAMSTLEHDATVEAAMNLADITRDLKPLLSLVETGDPHRLKWLATSMRYLSKLKQGGNREPWILPDNLDALITLLNSPRDISEMAVTTLLNLLITGSVKREQSSRGLLLALVSIIKEGTDLAQERAAAALFMLTTSPEQQKLLEDSDVVVALIRLLECGSLQGKKDAATALFNLAIHSKFLYQIIYEGGIGLCLQPNQNASLECKLIALLCNLARSRDARKEIINQQGIIYLAELLESEMHRTVEDAAHILLLLAQDGLHIALAIDREGVRLSLSKLSHVGSQRGKIKACKLLSILRGEISSNSHQDDLAH